MTGEHWTGRWWGGPLSDGTIVVTNPMIEIHAIVDLTERPTDEGLPPREPMYQPEPAGAHPFATWWSRRSSRVPRVPAPLPIAPMRITVLLVVVAYLAIGLAGLVFVEALWGKALAVGAAGAVAVALFLIIEWRKTPPSDLHLAHPSPEDPLAPLRYVEPEVASSAQFERITAIADGLEPHSHTGERVHLMLWKAAAIPVDGEGITPSDGAHLSELAAEAAMASRMAGHE